ncbi:MAG: HlyD family efflux transporter periplasmic adaptor subunit [Lautropia sp.]|nr:HlyD family efflux transporter periplasmic adaptor subunit [Lautropia sp.]
MKKVLFGLLVAMLGVAGCFGWRLFHHDEHARLMLYGNVEQHQVSLAFEAAGRVAEVLVEEGEQVRAGQVVATLDTHALMLQQEQAVAKVAVHQQELQRLRKGARPAEISQARHRLQAARSDAERAYRELARLRRIDAGIKGAVSTRDLDLARSAAQVADASVRERADALQLLNDGSRVEDIDAAEAQLRAARAQVALLQYQIGQGQLRAPVNARVRSRLMEPGEIATPQRPIITLSVDDPKWIRLYVDESRLGRVKPGMAAEIQADGVARRLSGTVGYISSVAEFTPKSVQTEDLRTSLVYEVRIRFADPDALLRLGQPVTVRLE